MTIVKLHGTHGAGKSTAVRRILAKYRSVAVLDQTKKRGEVPLLYRMPLPTGEELSIIGPYVSPCGGCDALQPMSRIWPLIEAEHKRGRHVLFEGALLSTTFGAIGEASEFYGNDFIWAFMDTPLEVCRARVNQRRAERGAGPIGDTRNIDSKFDTIQRLARKLETGNVGTAGVRPVVRIDHNNPAKHILKLFGVRLSKEPK